MRSPGWQSHSRQLRFEPLESRRVLSITVDTLVDENDGVGVGAGTSLREAIAAAVAGDTIDFSVTGTINLSFGASNTTKQLTVDKSVTINGPGANLLTINAFDPTPAQKNGDGSQVFRVTDNVTPNLLDVSISGITMSGGDTVNPGGGIFTTENVTLNNCVVSGNTSTNGDGGGIYSYSFSQLAANSLTIRSTTISGNVTNRIEGGGIRKRSGALTIEDSTITNNVARTAGGGISAADHGIVVQIRNTTISQNQALISNYGGGIFTFNSFTSIASSTISGNSAPSSGGIRGNFNGSGYGITLTDTVISDNTASANGNTGNGGGVMTYGGILSIIRCTISGNTASTNVGVGGGVDANADYFSVIDSTISGNSARVGGGIAGRFGVITGSTISGNTASVRAGAVYNSAAKVTIRSSTITSNTSPAALPGAVVTTGTTGTSVTLASSIVAGNTNGDVAAINSTSAMISLGYNLVGTGNVTNRFNQAGDSTGVVNLLLGQLADNGGPTKTHLPLAGSPAIDAGDPAAVAGVTPVRLYDQRGKPYTRVWDGDGSGGARIDIGAVELQTLPLPKAVYGDYNADGVVDGGDYVLSRKTVGASVTPYAGADGSGNGTIGSEDYDVWRAHYGETYAAGSGASADIVVDDSESLADSVGGVEATTPFAEAQGVPPVVVSSIRVGGRARVLRRAESGVAGRLRDDALVAWVESAAGVRKSGTAQVEAVGRDSAETDVDARSCDAIDAAVGELVSAAF